MATAVPPIDDLEDVARLMSERGALMARANAEWRRANDQIRRQNRLESRFILRAEPKYGPMLRRHEALQEGAAQRISAGNDAFDRARALEDAIVEKLALILAHNQGREEATNARLAEIGAALDRISTQLAKIAGGMAAGRKQLAALDDQVAAIDEVTSGLPQVLIPIHRRVRSNTDALDALRAAVTGDAPPSPAERTPETPPD
jgi:chromosome segregation ATPase